MVLGGEEGPRPGHRSAAGRLLSEACWEMSWSRVVATSDVMS